MNFLAIKDAKGKGVYQYSTKEERSSILQGLGLGKNAGKVFASKKEALLYANVKEVANRDQQVASGVVKKTPKKETVVQNNALNMLNICKEKGYDFAEITLTNGVKFDVILRDFIYLSSKNIIPSNSRSCGAKYIDSARYEYADYSRDSRSADNEIDNFKDFKNILLERISKTNEELGRYNRLYEEYTLEKSFNDIESYMSGRMRHNSERFKLFNRINATKIDVAGNFLFFDRISNIKIETIRSNTYYESYFKLKEENVAEDYILNTDYILSISPRRAEWKVDDKEFLNTIDKMYK